MGLEFSFFCFEKYLYTKFYKNPSSWSLVVLFGETDGYDEYNSSFSKYCERTYKLYAMSNNSVPNISKLPCRCRHTFTSTHGVTLHRTYQLQHRSDTFTSRFITAIHITWRNNGCDRQVQCIDRVTASFAVWCSLHQLSPSGAEQTPGDCCADAPTSLSRDPQLDDNYINFGEDTISYVSTFWHLQGIKVRHITGEIYK